MASSGIDIFGTGVRTKALLAIFLMEETHALELSRVLGVSKNTLNAALDGLVRAGLIVGTMEGPTRRVKLNPKFRARDELAAFLEKLTLGDPALLSAVADVRRRPRRAGKAL